MCVHVCVCVCVCMCVCVYVYVCVITLPTHFVQKGLEYISSGILCASKAPKWLQNIHSTDIIYF